MNPAIQLMMNNTAAEAFGSRASLTAQAFPGVVRFLAGSVVTLSVFVFVVMLVLWGL